MDTKSKKWTRNIVTKTIAFILVVILFTASVYTSGYLFYRGVNPEVLLVSDYKDSNEFEREVYNSLNYLYARLEGNETYRDISEGVEYYISDGEKIYKSSEKITPESLKKNAGAYFKYVDGVFYVPENVNQNIDYYYNDDTESTIFLNFPKDFLEEKQTNWETARDFLLPISTGMAIALACVLGLVIYLLVVTGKKEEDEEIHLNFLDRIYTEIFIVGYIGIMGILALVFSEIGFSSSFREWKEGATLLSAEVVSIV